MWKSKDKQQGWNTPDRHSQKQRPNIKRRPEPEVIDVEPKLSEQDLKHINKRRDKGMDDLIERS
jgi:hypothetical protein